MGQGDSCHNNQLLEKLVPANLKLVELRAELKKRGLSPSGLKHLLVKRLEEAIAEQQGGANRSSSRSADSTLPSPSSPSSSSPSSSSSIPFPSSFSSSSASGQPLDAPGRLHEDSLSEGFLLKREQKREDEEDEEEEEEQEEELHEEDQKRSRTEAAIASSREQEGQQTRAEAHHAGSSPGSDAEGALEADPEDYDEEGQEEEEEDEDEEDEDGTYSNNQEDKDYTSSSSSKQVNGEKVKSQGLKKPPQKRKKRRRAPWGSSGRKRRGKRSRQQPQAKRPRQSFPSSSPAASSGLLAGYTFAKEARFLPVLQPVMGFKEVRQGNQEIRSLEKFRFERERFHFSYQFWRGGTLLHFFEIEAGTYFILDDENNRTTHTPPPMISSSSAESQMNASGVTGGKRKVVLHWPPPMHYPVLQTWRFQQIYSHFFLSPAAKIISPSPCLISRQGSAFCLVVE